MSDTTRWIVTFAVIFLAGVLMGAVAQKATHPQPTLVVCDSVAPQPVNDPRNPYLREVVMGCTLDNVDGASVDVEFID